MKARALNDHDAELTVLRAVLTGRNRMAEIASAVEPQDFSDERHRHVAEAAWAVFDRRAPVDVVTVGHEMKARGTLDACGGPPFIDAIVNHGVPFVTRHAEIVAQFARLRALEASALDTAAKVRSQAAVADPDAFIADSLSLLSSTSSRRALSNFRSYGEIFADLLADAQARFQAGDERTTGISTGFRLLDLHATPMSPGDLWVVAARPGMGKTALMMQLAHSAADRGWVLVFSLEMEQAQVALRALAARSGVSAGQFRANLTAPMIESLARAAGELAPMRVAVDDTGGLTVEQIRSRALAGMTRYGDIAAVVVDYVQIIGASKGMAGAQDRTKIQHSTQHLKALAKELRVPVIVGSQLTRDSAKGKAKPELHQLRDSGAIEADADVVVLIHGEEAGDGPPTDSLERTFIVAKSRFGQLGEVEVNFVGRETRFYDHGPSRLSRVR